MKTKNISILSFIVVLCLVGCTTSPTTAQPTDEANMPNPASVYCEENGGQVEIRADDDGGQYGMCVFDDGSECDEWDFYYGECAPEDAEISGMPNPASVYCEESGGQVEIRADDDGGQYGMCIFADGSECDEWEFFRGECEPEDTEIIGMANPASVYCEEQGGQVEIRTDDEGGQYGLCVFANGSECDEWAFFRGECKP